MQRLYLSLLHPCSPSFPSQTAQGASRCSCIPSLDTASLLTGVCCFPSMDKDLGEHNQAGSPHFPAVMPPCPVAALGLADGTAGASSLLLLHPSHLCIPAIFLFPCSPLPLLIFLPLPSFSHHLNLFFSPLPAPHHPSLCSPSLLLRRRSIYWEC